MLRWVAFVPLALMIPLTYCEVYMAVETMLLFKHGLHTTSSTRIVQHKQYVCCALLFLRGSPTDWSNLYTAVKTIVCSFTTL